MSLIELKNISKSFEQKKVLDRIDLSIEAGEAFLILGRSGAGKTVLLRHLIGLIHPDSGRVLIDGKDLNQLDEQELVQTRLKFGVVFQNSALFDSLTVGENVGFALIQHSALTKAEILPKVHTALEMVGLEGIEELYPYELSGGMRKRVAIARAIIYRPKIIIYDEPTTGIDPISVDKIVHLIQDLHQRLSITTLVVTHDLDVGLKIAQRVAFLLQGKIIFEGNKDDLQNPERITDPRVVQFIQGSSSGPIKEMEV
ncbi:MAG: ATP-binding cassette domain-containing protein [Candidatus Omnitrophica bacterium]|nr:ATP-binding cassette domain-containing protein [Candidatus Omnitrophota bacterium]